MYAAVADFEAYVTDLRKAKAAIMRGDAPHATTIAPTLLQSWQRSHAHGIRCDDRRLLAANYPLYVIDDADRQLSTVAGEEIDAIWDSFGGENWAVYCTNAQGLITRVRHGSNPLAHAFALHVGRRLQESDLGTTAPACAIAQGHAVTLVGAEHYLDEFGDFFCCAVPLWGPLGTLVGVLNITGSEAFKSRLVERKLMSAAVKIENRLFLEAHQRHTVFKIHYDADFIDTHLAGLIAINTAGDLLSATRNAREMLDDLDPFARRCNVRELFQQDLAVVTGYCLKSSLNNGIVFYTKVCGEHAATALAGNASVHDGGSLQALSQVHMRETLRSVGGNISKAAKLLGVSRNTLYRALGKP
ncbi:transcriptional regulator of acetoin/glycerol metabolism [Pseudomonas sp. TE3610]